jgi:putative tricarboxylic transport membrane protein
MDALVSAALTVASPEGLALLVAGSALALILGILPGLSSTEAMIIALPFTFALGLNESMILMSAIYAAAFVGGALTSILFGIPGSSTNLVTQLDGYPLHRQGRTIFAVSAAAGASVVGGLVSLLLVVALLPVMGPLSLLFGPPEWFAFVLLGLVVLAFSGTGAVLAGLAAAGCGLMLSTVGLSVITGMPRFTFGLTELWGGIPIVAAFVGIYPFAEAFGMALRGGRGAGQGVPAPAMSGAGSAAEMRAGLAASLRHVHAWSTGTLVGWIVGVIPGVGGVLANFLGYAVVRSTARDRARFGQGDVRGVIASEAANNASAGGALVPTLALGIPGSLNTAILLGVFLINGIQPGANVFAQNLEVTWVILISSAVATVLASAVVLAAGWRLLAAIARVPQVAVAPVVIFLGCLAVLLARGNPFDLVFAGAMGALGLVCKRYGFSRISVVIALMLGDLVESAYFQSLAIGRGSHAVFFASTTAKIIWGCILLTVLLHLLRLRGGARHAPSGRPGGGLDDA